MPYPWRVLQAEEVNKGLQSAGLCHCLCLAVRISQPRQQIGSNDAAVPATRPT